MGERMEIRTVVDFFAVPAEKRAHCLKDFAMWLEMVAAAKSMFGDIEGVHLPIDKFQWIDDGKHDAHIHVTVSGDTPDAPR